MDILQGLHNNIMFYLTIILFAICLIMLFIIFYYNKHLKDKLIKHATINNLILLFTVFRLSYLDLEVSIEKILILFSDNTGSGAVSATDVGNETSSGTGVATGRG